ncbi:MAG: hypothetical protein ACYTG0_26440 [Planctomycetota bacterium]|jgi:hypothetical protein
MANDHACRLSMTREVLAANAGRRLVDVLQHSLGERADEIQRQPLPQRFLADHHVAAQHRAGNVVPRPSHGRQHGGPLAVGSDH